MACSPALDFIYKDVCYLQILRAGRFRRPPALYQDRTDLILDYFLLVYCVLSAARRRLNAERANNERDEENNLLLGSRKFDSQYRNIMRSISLLRFLKSNTMSPKLKSIDGC